jgi:hypothetical protein
MAKAGDGDFLRSVAESVPQIIMEADVDDNLMRKESDALLRSMRCA